MDSRINYMEPENPYQRKSRLHRSTEHREWESYRGTTWLLYEDPRGHKVFLSPKGKLHFTHHDPSKFPDGYIPGEECRCRSIYYAFTSKPGQYYRSYHTFSGTAPRRLQTHLRALKSLHNRERHKDTKPFSERLYGMLGDLISEILRKRGHYSTGSGSGVTITVRLSPKRKKAEPSFYFSSVDPETGYHDSTVIIQSHYSHLLEAIRLTGGIAICVRNACEYQTESMGYLVYQIKHIYNENRMVAMVGIQSDGFGKYATNGAPCIIERLPDNRWRVVKKLSRRVKHYDKY